MDSESANCRVCGIHGLNTTGKALTIASITLVVIGTIFFALALVGGKNITDTLMIFTAGIITLMASAFMAVYRKKFGSF